MDLNAAVGLACAGIVHAQQKAIAIGTGTGGADGVYDPLGGAVDNLN